MKRVSIQILICMALCSQQSALVSGAGFSGKYECIVKGRVVNKFGQPVSGANIILAAINIEKEKGEPQSWGPILETSPTDDQGFFSLEIDSDKYSRWVLYIVRPIEPDANLIIYPPFPVTLKRIDSRYSGRELNIGREVELDLGNVAVQVMYSQVLVHITSDTHIKLLKNLSLRVRDAYGDRVSESGLAPVYFHDDHTSVAISLPPGKWYIGMAHDESRDWREVQVLVPDSQSQTPIEVSLNLNRKASIPQKQQYRDEVAAKKELENRRFQFTSIAYIERVKSCNTEAIELFLQAGMSVNAQDNEGNTALMWAISQHCQSAIDVLMREKAEINVKNNLGAGSLSLAVLNYNYEVIKALLKAGAEVDAGLNDGRTALMLAAFSGRTDIANLLLKAGANVNLRDKDGKTALKWAMEHDNQEMIDLLKKAGAKE